ncbi:MAG: hypothetical protein JXR37_18940 [Kiritimatiellae bacterium]|nr:hypothetical protein [Kiritimatiellia bacterium]
MSGTDNGSLCAGVAKREITTDRAGVAVHDPLYAKALVLDDGRTQVAIVAMDTIAIGGRAISRGILADVGEDFLPAVRGEIERELGIAGSHVLVNASHTHPPGRLLCEDDEQVARTVDAVREAFRNRVPVRVGAGFGHEDGITVNRTLRLKNGRAWTVRHSHPCPPDDEVAGVGPIDPEIGILRVDRLDGRPLALVYNFACHPLFGNAQGSITANFPGVASRLIEQTLGHGALALFLQGAGGDVIDVGFKDFTRPRDIAPIGARLGLSALEAFREIRVGGATLNVRSATVELPRRTDIPARVGALEREQADLLESLRSTSLNFKAFLPLYLRYALDAEHPLADSYRYRQADATGQAEPRAMDALNRRNMDKYLAAIRAMERMAVIREDIATLRKHQAINAEAGSPTIGAEVQGIRIGDCALLAAPLELLVEIGLNIKKASPHKHTLVAGFSNGYLHYGPPAADYERGGYEVNECLLAPEWQAAFEAAAAEVLRGQ